MKRIALMFSVLVLATSMSAGHAVNDLEHWLHICDKPRLEYWNKLCLESVAAREGAQPANSAPVRTGAFNQAGRDLAASCAICHGTNGVNTGGMPNLAAQPQERLARQLRDFRDGKLPATIMHQIAKGLTEEQIEAVSAYWSAQQPQ
jgi:cytochrome subunit of sulfide dehydrogenase